MILERLVSDKWFNDFINFFLLNSLVELSLCYFRGLLVGREFHFLFQEYDT